MIYRIQVPPNTLEAGAVVAHYDIARRTINRAIVRIPEGHKELAALQILTRGRLIVPEFGSGERWIRGNGNIQEIPFSPALVLDGPPYEITLRAYNEDDTYPHGFSVEVS
jgi:hypothetical protein